MAPHEWDGRTYDRISAPLEMNGRDVLARLQLRGDETVLDAGCGSGRVTEALLERLPHGRVIGVDGSAGMIEAAAERLGDRAELFVSDLTELDLGGRRVDAVFSTAVFHWIADHNTLFSRIHAVLQPGGQFVAQCGGAGNCPELDSAIEAAVADGPFTEYLAGWTPWNYSAPDMAHDRLLRAGFSSASTGLVQAPVPYDDLHEWLGVNSLSAHQLRLPEELRQPFVDAVYAGMDDDIGVTYIRLNIDAVA